MEPVDFSSINDDEMLAAVLEMSRQEAGLSAAPTLEEEQTNSPDTGFGDTEATEPCYQTELMDTDSKQPAGIATSCW